MQKSGHMPGCIIYDVDAYTNIEGVVTELNPPYRRLKVVKTAIPFDDIYIIEMLGKDILF